MQETLSCDGRLLQARQGKVVAIAEREEGIGEQGRSIRCLAITRDIPQRTAGGDEQSFAAGPTMPLRPRRLFPGILRPSIPCEV